MSNIDWGLKANESYNDSKWLWSSDEYIDAYLSGVREALNAAIKAALSDHPDKYTNQNEDFNHGQAFAADSIRALLPKSENDK